MKVSVFGPSGMLGRQVIKQLKEQGHEARPIYRQMFQLLSKPSIQQVLSDSDVAINCAGVIPSKSTDIVDMIRVNAEFPHLLVSCDLPVLLVSTDCVFSGKSNRAYTVRSQPDPIDYYGRSKALGEALRPNSVVIRTSFIGCEHGFMHWVMAAGQVSVEGTLTRIDGYKNALWTGSTVTEVSKSLVGLLGEGGDNLSKALGQGIIHMATDQVVNKYDLAVKIVELKSLNVEVYPTYHPTINRALEPTPGHKLPDIDTALTDYTCSGAIG